MNDQSPNSRLPPQILQNSTPQPINSDLYDPMQQMHIPINLHQPTALHQPDLYSYFHHSQSNSFNLNHDERNTPSFHNQYDFQTKYHQFQNHQNPPLCKNCNLNTPVPSSLYCHHCNNESSNKYDGNLSTNIATNQYHPMRKPEYRPQYPNNNTTSSLNYEDPLFKPLFEHPSPPSRPNQHNTLLPTFAPKIPPSLENKNFVYSSNISVSSTIHQQMPSTYLPPPTLSVNNPRNAGRNFQYSGHYKRPSHSHSYGEDHYQPHNPKSFPYNRNRRNRPKNLNQRSHSEENNTNTRENIQFLEPSQKPKENHTVDMNNIEEFSFKKQKKKLKYDDVIDIVSDSPDEGPQITLQELLKSKKSDPQPVEEEDENTVNRLVQNLMVSNSEFNKRQEEQKRQEEIEIAKKDEQTKEFAEIISRKEEKVFKHKKSTQQTTHHAKFPKDILNIITKTLPKKKKKEVRRDTDPLEKIFDKMRFKDRNPLKKTSSSHHSVKEKHIKSTNFLDDIITFGLIEPSSSTAKNPKSKHITSRDRPRRPINSKRSFNELDNDDEKERLDYLEKHFKSETLYEDGIGLHKPKIIEIDEEEENSVITLESESYESSGDESQYFPVDDKKYGIILECYSNESDFIDIYEVKRKTQEFKVIGQNKEDLEQIGDVIYPRKSVIHVGEAYQAHIPRLLHKPPAESRSFCKVWDPERLTRGSFDYFMAKLSSLVGLSISKISEQKAVEMLVDQNYDFGKALKFCNSNLDHVKETILCT